MPAQKILAFGKKIRYLDALDLERKGMNKLTEEIPHIYYQVEKINGLQQDKLTIEVRGQTLSECRTHFDEIKKGCDEVE